MQESSIGLIKADTRSFDYSSYAGEGRRGWRFKV